MQLSDPFWKFYFVSFYNFLRWSLRKHSEKKIKLGLHFCFSISFFFWKKKKKLLKHFQILPKEFVPLWIPFKAFASSKIVMLCFPNFVHVRNKIYYLSKEQESQFRTSEEKVSFSLPQLLLNFSIKYFQSKSQVFLLFFRSGSRSGSLRASNGEDGGSDEEESGKKLVFL